jgi:hypothetical protein
MLALPKDTALLAGSRYRDDEFAVLFGDEVFGTAGGAAACVFFLNLDDELFRWFEIQANFAGWSIHRTGCFLNVFRRETNKLDAGNFFPGPAGLHHFVKLEGLGIRSLCVKETLQSGCVLAFQCCFVFVGECLFLRWRGCHDCREGNQECDRECEQFQ